MAQFIPVLVKADRTGFVADRLATGHSRLLCNVIQEVVVAEEPCAVVLIDAEKAFERVEWSFLRYILAKFSCSLRCREMVEVLYTCPKTRILANGCLSPIINLNRCTRQECPQSPLLFILVLEPLLEKIRSNPDITGIGLTRKQVKRRAYADNILLYLSDPARAFRSLECGIRVLCPVGI